MPPADRPREPLRLGSAEKRAAGAHGPGESRPDSRSEPLRQVTTSLLLVVVVVAACAGFALLGGIVLPGIGGLVAWIGLGFLGFLAAQLLLFRAFGLRSRADAPDREESGPERATGEPAEGTEGEPDDWRAWRG